MTKRTRSVRTLWGGSRRARERIILGVLALVIIFGIGVVAFSFLPRGKPSTVKIYFYKGEKLVAVERRLKPEEAPLRKAIFSLLAGPSKEEVNEGITTLLPHGVKIRLLRTEGSTAIIDFSREIEFYGGGSSRVEGLVAQIVYTATGIPGIEKVWIWVEGQKEVALGGEGLVLDHPLSRRDLSY